MSLAERVPEVGNTSYENKLREFTEAGLELCKVTTEDVPVITALINQSAPEAKHASYYPAMLTDLMNESCMVVKDQNTGKIIGTTLGLDRVSFQKDGTESKALFLSHVVTDEGEKAQLAKEMMVHQTFRNAANRGVTEITADLDASEDEVIANTVRTAAVGKFMNVALNFANDNPDTTNIRSFHPDRDSLNIVRFQTEKPGITLRHPSTADAGAMRKIVLLDNGNAEENIDNGQAVNGSEKSQKGGLDSYALSSYERMAGAFSETSMVAEENGEVVGFITGFLLPGKGGPELFIWQIGVHPEHQGKGIGPLMQVQLAEQLNAQRILTTIEGVNENSQRAFRKLAGYMGSSLEPTGEVVSSETLGNGHAPELYFEIRRGSSGPAPK